MGNLYYLSSRQALADFATFKTFIMKQYNLTNNTWISYGGSYSGALSAWLRIKYPDVVRGAVASSGPVQAEVDFYQYLEVVTASLAASKSGKCMCTDAVNFWFQDIGGLLQPVVVMQGLGMLCVYIL